MLKSIVLSLCVFLLPGAAHAEPVSLEELTQKVKALDDAIEDETAKLSFRVIDETGAEKKSTHLLYWKNENARDGLVSKILLATVTPLNLRGEGWLIWEAEKFTSSQAWLYLPDLRQVRRVEVSEHHHGHSHGHGHGMMDEPESDLLFEEATHRSTGSGERSIVGEEVILGEPYIVVDQASDPSEPSAKRRFWVSPKNWTTKKTEYYDARGRLLKTQWLDWQEVKGVWLWKRTEVRLPQSSKKTVIELTDLQVNTGLDTGFFSERTLLSGRLP